jgi:hypothetical protein
MRWMTKREVERAAKRGPLAALDNSIAKWMQMRDAPARELKRKIGPFSMFDGEDYCACCIYSHGRLYSGCAACPINKHIGYCGDCGYDKYENMRDCFLRGGPITPVRKAIRTLIRNMKKARKILQEKQNA